MNKIISVFLFILLSASLSGQDVAQWRGSVRDGIYNEKGLLKKWPDTGPKLIWHFDELGEGFTSAAVTAKGVFITGMIKGQGNIFSFDLKGKLLWKKEYGPEWTDSHNGVRSTPLVVKDHLFFESAFGKVVCMNCSDGQTLWTVDLVKQYGAENIEWGMTENLLYDGNTLYCTPGGKGASMVALDMNSGKEIWKSKSNKEKSAYCSPMIIKLPNRKIIVTIMQYSICGFDASTGIQLWKSDFTMDPDVHPNTPVYIEIYGKRTASCDPKMGGVVVLDGRIYGTGDRNRKFFCLDWKTGKELYSTRELSPANIIADDGLLYVYSESGKVSLVEPQADKINVLSFIFCTFRCRSTLGSPGYKG